MDLNILLQRAQNFLNATASNCELPRTELTLQQVLQSTNELHARVTQTGNKDVQAHILLGSKGVNLNKINQKLDALINIKSFEPVDAATSADADVSTFLKNERESAILSVIEDTNQNISESVSKLKWMQLNSNWNAEKVRLLDAVIGPSQNFLDLQRLPEHITVDPQSSPRFCLDQRELLYAQELRQYNELLLNGSSRPNLVQKFAKLAATFGDYRLSTMWNILACVSDVAEPCHTDPIQNRQQRPEFVTHAKAYLERRYKVYMQTQIHPGTGKDSYELVHAFVACRFGAQQTIGLVDTVCGKPLWPLVYYSLRCGAAQTALAFLHEAGPNCDDFAQLIADRSEGIVNSKMENQLKLQYANKIRNSTDAFKKAVYCIILGCDTNELHTEVAKTTDDFLWIKLAMLRAGDALGYGELQSLILEKYGEKYFKASQQPHVYFQTLALTGQFEAAIEFLARTDTNCAHAVHMAIALNELGLLGSCRSVTQPLLSIDIMDPAPLRRLNLTRLIRQYAQRFERTDTAEALHYYFTLHTLQDANGRNMFLVCVCDLVLDSGVLDTTIFDFIFGPRPENDDEQIIGGMFQQFECADFDKSTLATMVADELVNRGQFERAVRLYDMAGNYNLALKHLCILLAQVIHQPETKDTLRSRICQEAQRFRARLERYESELEPKLIASYKLLMDLLAFFDSYNEGKCIVALQLLKKTQLIPFSCKDVDACLANVKRLCGELVKVLPEVMVAAMDIIYTQYKQLKSETMVAPNEQQFQELRERANALANMAANLHCMSFDTNQRLLQLELMMH